MSIEIIKIDINSIREYYNSIDINSIPDVLKRKKKEIYDNHNCFHTTHQDFSDFKKYSKYPYKKKEFVRNNNNTVPQNNNTHHNKLYILPVDFTEENIVKKTFTGCLNKLTDKNRDNIFAKLKEILEKNKDNNDIVKILYDIVWDFIKKSPSQCYIDIIGLFDKELTQSYIYDYVHHKKWYPCKDIHDNNILAIDKELYDIYCLYVKWKKEITNINSIILNLNTNEGITNKLLEDIFELLEKHKDDYKKHKHLIDFSLEQISNILKKYYSPHIINKVKEIDYSSYDSSTKFYILDILEL